MSQKAKADPTRSPSVAALVEEELTAPQPEAAVAAARHVAARHGEAVQGVLFYGSCLRTGEIEGKVLDFYILVDRYPKAYDKRWLAVANRLLPPNVFYDQFDHGGLTLRSKYNVISLDDFARRCRPETLNTAIWGRFAQPAALLLPRNAEAKAAIVEAVAQAVRTMLGSVLPLCRAGADAEAVWTCAMERSYATELRAEAPGKSEELYQAGRERYDRLFAAAMAEMDVPVQRENGRLLLDNTPSSAERRRAERRWALRKLSGKTESLLRLIKGAFTFEGGFEYIAWKIRRHSGVEIEVTPWRRRHPLLAGLLLFWRLRRKGAFR